MKCIRIKLDNDLKTGYHKMNGIGVVLRNDHIKGYDVTLERVERKTGEGYYLIEFIDDIQIDFNVVTVKQTVTDDIKNEALKILQSL
mgnify:CR=1 FL=1